ncbi:hypothetical protein [Lysobacter enzymogenes]|uniref:hypothetical protein n=1 Tax=Lysobacter enzymogenes TaxID=69 RepID=UPI001A97B87F|nr:hypothetical protein [Lysobacter enzymogenes]QQP95870.1 hypothetical protein JHW38_22065 [Lysobacter enzymogenes]
MFETDYWDAALSDSSGDAMRTFAISVLLAVGLAATPGVRAASDEMHGLAILKNDYPEAKSWPLAAKGSIEFCGGDWCQEVMGVGAKSFKEAGDAAFVLFYFLDRDEEYTRRRSDAADSIIARSAKQCLVQNADLRASCVLDSLQKKFGFKYRRVQYDMGYRCHSEIAVAPPFFTQKGKCARMRKGAFPEQAD